MLRYTVAWVNSLILRSPGQVGSTILVRSGRVMVQKFRPASVSAKSDVAYTRPQITHIIVCSVCNGHLHHYNSLSCIELLLSSVTCVYDTVNV